jgi:hypothetical protein
MIPSVKTLSAVFGDNAKTARKVLEMTYDEIVRFRIDRLIITNDLEGKCYHRPTLMELILDTLNALADTHGIEHIDMCRKDGTSQYLTYLNTGDMYTPTIVFWNGMYRVADVGTKVEVLERQGWFA